MPITKRRKTEQGEGNTGEKGGQRVGTEGKDVVTEKLSKVDHKNEQKHRNEPQDQAQVNESNSKPKVPHIGAVTRSRVVRKPKRDLSPPPSPTKKPAKEAKEAKTNTPETKQKRQWELWSVDDKDAFFEGLFETGKDFEAVQNYIAQKSKKKGVIPSLVKNKDQVRHFFYRTWHKISKYIQPTPDVKKETQELYGLINYGVLRKRIKGLTDKTGAKLNDLVHNGFTTVKIRGKNLRIKTPICLALKKLNNIDTTEHKCDPANRIPHKIHVEMNPKTNIAWNMIQEMSFNPRVKLMLKPNRTLSSVITYLNQKWKSHRLKLKENVSGAEPEVGAVLTVYPHPDCDITPLTLQATKEQKINITFSDYRENINIFNSPSVSREKKAESTKTTSTVHSENSHSVDFMDPRNGMFDSPKSRGFGKDSKGGMTPTSSSAFCADAAFLSEGENAMFPDTPLSKNDSKSTENLTETDSTDCSPPKQNVAGNKSETVKNSSSDDDKCLDSEKEDQESLNIKEALEKGWTSFSAENLTFAQLYLMFGKDNKIRLEYEFCKENTIVDIVKAQLTNTLRRLVHLAAMEITDVKVSSSSSSPCHTCGAVRAKATRGCGVKGQRAISKNPLSSKVGTAEGMADAGTQTTFKDIGPINSSQSKEAVFRVPVAGASFLQKSTVPGVEPIYRPVNQAFGVLAPGYKNGKRIRQVNRKPMVVQRTILPKAPNIFTLVQPTRHNLKTVINVPNSMPMLSSTNCSTAVCGSVKAVQLDVQAGTRQHTITLDPSQLQSHATPSQLDMQSPQTVMLGPGQIPVNMNSSEVIADCMELPITSTINVCTTAIATNHAELVTTASRVQGSLSPPSISNLLDMSFSNFGTPGDGEKLFDMALGTGSSYCPLLDEGTNKGTVSNFSTPKIETLKRENILISPPCTSAWMNGEVGDISFMSLLNETSKPPPTTSSLQPQALFFENSRDSSIMGKFDVDTLMNESSLDFVAKFADLQALTQDDTIADVTNSKKTISNG